MTTKFKAIVSAVIAATLTAGISATALAINSDKSVDSEPIAITESNSETAVKKYSSMAEMLSPFELAIMMGEAPEHPDGRTYPIERTIEEQTDTNSTNSNIIALTRNTDVTGYNFWTGRFIVPDLSGFSINFKEPESFDCSFDGSEKSATIKAKPAYAGNYKSVRINYIFEESNGQKTAYFVEKTGTGNTITTYIEDSYTGNGTLVEVVCLYCLRSGTGSTSTIRDYAAVHLVDSSYAKSAAYAAEPYSGLIDTYTYISEEMLSNLQ